MDCDRKKAENENDNEIDTTNRVHYSSERLWDFPWSPGQFAVHGIGEGLSRSRVWLNTAVRSAVQKKSIANEV